ncbi:hypothetical protein CASFOL_025689 [Castilleja foliolosa]|uniref:Uncharacterized protein n=1 Tax=Castilleja foliolosa TaxID=1961234 RepID=A0ABD3CRV9_9LAMI
MCDSRRTKLTTEDVDRALGLRNVEVRSMDLHSKKFRRAAGHKDLFYFEEKYVEFKGCFHCMLITKILKLKRTDYLLTLNYLFSMFFYENFSFTLSRSESPLFKEALMNLETDFGIHPLVPYFMFLLPMSCSELEYIFSPFCFDASCSVPSTKYTLSHIIWPCLSQSPEPCD